MNVFDLAVKSTCRHQANGIPSIDEGLQNGDMSNSTKISDPADSPDSGPIIEGFLQFLKDDFDPINAKIELLLSEGNIRFEYLWRFFPIDSDVVFRHTESGLKCAGKVFNY
jgi:hypothetical protein